MGVQLCVCLCVRTSSYKCFLISYGTLELPGSKPFNNYTQLNFKNTTTWVNVSPRWEEKNPNNLIEKIIASIIMSRKLQCSFFFFNFTFQSILLSCYRGQGYVTSDYFEREKAKKHRISEHFCQNHLPQLSWLPDMPLDVCDENSKWEGRLPW